MAYLKPQSPLKKGEDYIYPLTTTDQIITEDGERLSAKAVYLDSSGSEDGVAESVNADTLGGLPASAYQLIIDPSFSLSDHWLTGFQVLGHGIVVPLHRKCSSGSDLSAQAFTSSGWIDLVLNGIETDGTNNTRLLFNSLDGYNGQALLVKVTGNFS